jgi:hypothetical protein
MCEYSLAHTASRPAVVEDVLVTSSFIGTITRGFAPVGEPNVAACLLPGSELAFTAPVKYRQPIDVVATDSGQTTATFRQINLDKPHTHHDALEFPNGEVVLLTCLVEGQTATVLQLPAAPKTAEEKKAQERIATTG